MATALSYGSVTVASAVRIPGGGTIFGGGGATARGGTTTAGINRRKAEIGAAVTPITGSAAATAGDGFCSGGLLIIISGDDLEGFQFLGRISGGGITGCVGFVGRLVAGNHLADAVITMRRLIHLKGHAKT